MLTTTPVISVIITTYNVEKFIKEAIYSVLLQTVQDFEIIIVDDGSTDGTVNVIESITDKRIKLIQNGVNKGRVHSLNLAFREAKGKYIAITDGDDINLLNRFEKQLIILENNSDIKVCGSWYKEFGFSNKVVRHAQNHEAVKAKLLLNCSMTFGGSMFDRVFVKDFRFDRTKIHVEDYDFWSKMAWKGKFYNIQEVLYHYRIHKTQVSTLYNPIQKTGDLPIKLFLFKKIKYDDTKFTDNFIEKMLWQNEPISVNEFKLFLNWLQTICILNKQQNVFDNYEFKNVINQIKQQLIFKIYFLQSNLGITKDWRKRSLKHLAIKDLAYVLMMKSREIMKKFKK